MEENNVLLEIMMLILFMYNNNNNNTVINYLIFIVSRWAEVLKLQLPLCLSSLPLLRYFLKDRRVIPNISKA